jgi:hypothetical protein
LRGKIWLKMSSFMRSGPRRLLIRDAAGFVAGCY